MGNENKNDEKSVKSIMTDRLSATAAARSTSLHLISPATIISNMMILVLMLLLLLLLLIMINPPQKQNNMIFVILI